MSTIGHKETFHALSCDIAQAAPVVQEATVNGQRVLASPLAKKIASEKGIQLTQVRLGVLGQTEYDL